MFCFVAQKSVFCYNKSHITSLPDAEIGNSAAQLIAHSESKLVFPEGLPANSTIGLSQ